MSTILQAGTVAPEFTLSPTPDKKLSLSELRGKPVILAFYPADWSPVCGDQMALYNEVLTEFQKYGAELLGVSVDGVWCHAAFTKDRHLQFPLLADFEPKGEVARSYGVYRAEEGVSERALFVIDRDGVIAWSYLSPIAINPGADGILEALEKLSKWETSMSKLSIPISSRDHVQGDLTAECSLVEYGDYECPSCGEAYPIVKEIQKHFGKRLCFVFRNFPLAQAHPWAETAAEVAEFAGAHGKFWEMHDLLYENQDSFGEDLFPRLALMVKLSSAELQTAIAQQTYRARVRTDFSGGVRSGVNGTPTFFVNGQRHDGPFDISSLSAGIERSLGVYDR